MPLNYAQAGFSASIRRTNACAIRARAHARLAPRRLESAARSRRSSSPPLKRGLRHAGEA